MNGSRHLGMLWQDDGTSSAESYAWGGVDPESLPVGTIVSIGSHGELIATTSGTTPIFGVIGFGVNNVMEYATVITRGCVNARSAANTEIGQPPFGASQGGIVRDLIIGEIQLKSGQRVEVEDCIRLQL